MYLVPLFAVVTVTEDATAARDEAVIQEYAAAVNRFSLSSLLRPCWVYHSFGSSCNLLHGAVMSPTGR